MFLISNHYFVTVLWISSCLIDSMLFLFYYCNIFLISLGYTTTLGEVSAPWKVLVSSQWRGSVCSSGRCLPRWKLSLHSTLLGWWLTVRRVWKLYRVNSWNLDSAIRTCGWPIRSPFSSPWRLKVHLDVFSLVGWSPRRLSSYLLPKRWRFPDRSCLSPLHTVTTSQFCQRWELHLQTPAEAGEGPWGGGGKLGAGFSKQRWCWCRRSWASSLPSLVLPFEFSGIHPFGSPHSHALLGIQISQTHSTSYFSLVYFLASKFLFLLPPSF